MTNVLIMTVSNWILFALMAIDWNKVVTKDFFGLQLSASELVTATLIISSLGCVCEIIPLARYSYKLKKMCQKRRERIQVWT